MAKASNSPDTNWKTCKLQEIITDEGEVSEGRCLEQSTVMEYWRGKFMKTPAGVFDCKTDFGSS